MYLPLELTIVIFETVNVKLHRVADKRPFTCGYAYAVEQAGLLPLTFQSLNLVMPAKKKLLLLKPAKEGAAKVKDQSSKQNKKRKDQRKDIRSMRVL
jgi:hypothetical protein